MENLEEAYGPLLRRQDMRIEKKVEHKKVNPPIMHMKIPFCHFCRKTMEGHVKYCMRIPHKWVIGGFREIYVKQNIRQPSFLEQAKNAPNKFHEVMRAGKSREKSY